jgi:hypothetical protein
MLLLACNYGDCFSQHAISAQKQSLTARSLCLRAGSLPWAQHLTAIEVGSSGIQRNIINFQADSITATVPAGLENAGKLASLDIGNIKCKGLEVAPDPLPGDGE